MCNQHVCVVGREFDWAERVLSNVTIRLRAAHACSRTNTRNMSVAATQHKVFAGRSKMMLSGPR